MTERMGLTLKSEEVLKSLGRVKNKSAAETLTISTSFFSSSISFSFFFPFAFFLPPCSEVAASSYCSRPSWKHNGTINKERTMFRYLKQITPQLKPTHHYHGADFWMILEMSNTRLQQIWRMATGTKFRQRKYNRFSQKTTRGVRNVLHLWLCQLWSQAMSWLANISYFFYSDSAL